MNTSPEIKSGDSRLKTYLIAAIFVLPSLLAAQFTNLFLLPKLSLIQKDAGLSDAQLYGFLNWPRLLANHGTLVIFALVLMLLLLEWRWRAWARYRKALLGCLVWLINAIVLLDLTLIIIATVLMAPALMRR